MRVERAENIDRFRIPKEGNSNPGKAADFVSFSLSLTLDLSPLGGDKELEEHTFLENRGILDESRMTKSFPEEMRIYIYTSIWRCLVISKKRFPFRFPISKIITEKRSIPTPFKNSSRNLSGLTGCFAVPFLMHPFLLLLPVRCTSATVSFRESRRPRGPGFPVSLIFIIANTRLALKGPILGLAEAGPVLDLSRERRPTHVVSKGASNGPTPPPPPPPSPTPVLLPSAATHPVSRATRSLLPIFRSPLSNVP